MLRSLTRYYESQGLSPWHFLPLSFILPNFRLLNTAPAVHPAWQQFAVAPV